MALFLSDIGKTLFLAKFTTRRHRYTEMPEPPEYEEHLCLVLAESVPKAEERVRKVVRDHDFADKHAVSLYRRRFGEHSVNLTMNVFPVCGAKVASTYCTKCSRKFGYGGTSELGKVRCDACLVAVDELLAAGLLVEEKGTIIEDARDTSVLDERSKARRDGFL